MSHTPKISGSQLGALLLAGRLSNCLLFTSRDFQQFTLWDCIFSMLLNGILLLVLLLPTVLWLRRGTVQAAYDRSPSMGKVVSALYLAVCFFVLVVDVLQFFDFAQKTMKADFSVFVLTAAFIGVCLIAALYGIEALGRAAMPVAVLSGICLILFTVTLVPEMELLHFPPVSAGGIGRVVSKAVSDLPRSAEVVAIGLLYPYVNGSATKGVVGFSGATAGFSALASVTAIGVLGDYAAQTAYPYYAAVTAAQVGVFQRLDIFVTALWLGTFFVRFTLFCMLFLEQSRRLFGNRARMVISITTFIALLLVAFGLQSGIYRGGWQFLTPVYWGILIGFCIVLPLILRRRSRI